MQKTILKMNGLLYACMYQKNYNKQVVCLTRKIQTSEQGPNLRVLIIISTGYIKKTNFVSL